MSSDGETEDKMSRFQAELVAREQEALEVIKEDVCQWLGRVLSLNVTPSSFMAVLDTGVPLCSLVAAIQTGKTAADEAGNQLDVSIPMDSIKCNPKAESGSFFARDNTANFITWCRKMGIEEAVIFESDGLVEHKDEKRVILCLLDVARFADKVGISPPELIKMEREIEQLPPSPSNMNSDLEELPLSPEPQDQDDKEDDEVPRPKRRRVEQADPQTEGDGAPVMVVQEAAIETQLVEAEGDGSVSLLEQAEGGGAPVMVVQEAAIETQLVEAAGDGSVSLLQQKDVTIVSSEKVKKPKVEKKLSVDERVMMEMRACKCQQKMRVRNCGNGKFVIQRAGARKMTIYARLLSDRVMVRVGGGWDTLEHFLLKHDPCRILALPSSKTSSRKGNISSVRKSKPSSTSTASTSPYESTPFSRGILSQARGKRPRET